MDHSSKIHALQTTGQTHQSQQLLDISQVRPATAWLLLHVFNKVVAAAIRDAKTHRLQQSDNSRSGDSA